jgi:hypothetical protein
MDSTRATASITPPPQQPHRRQSAQPRPGRVARALLLRAYGLCRRPTSPGVMLASTLASAQQRTTSRAWLTLLSVRVPSHCEKRMPGSRGLMLPCVATISA